MITFTGSKEASTDKQATDCWLVLLLVLLLLLLLCCCSVAEWEEWERERQAQAGGQAEAGGRAASGVKFPTRFAPQGQAEHNARVSGACLPVGLPACSVLLPFFPPIITPF